MALGTSTCLRLTHSWIAFRRRLLYSAIFASVAVQKSIIGSSLARTQALCNCSQGLDVNRPRRENPSASYRYYSRQTCTFQQSQRNHDSMHTMPPSSISHTPRCDSGKLSMPICVVPMVNNEDIRCNKDYERPSCARRHANDDMAAQQVPYHCDFKMFVSILVQDVPCAASVKFSYWRRYV